MIEHFHRIELKMPKDRANPFPESSLAAQLFPNGTKEIAAELLGLVHEKRQHHEDDEHTSEMLLTQPIVVAQVIALSLERIEGLVLDPPS